MTSTINPNIPAFDSGLNSAPIRSNFQAAYNDVNNLQAQINAIIPSTSVNIFTPEQFGALGNAVGAQDGVISGVSNNQFSSATVKFTQDRVNTLLWFDATDRVITSVDVDGVATFSPVASGHATGRLWLSGTDDTVAIQAALDAARDVQGTDIAEGPGSTDGLINSGGVCELAAGKAYIISNSQASYDGGKLSALVVYRRTDFRGNGLASSRSALCMRPNSYGHMVANFNTGTLGYTDFLGIGRFTCYGYQEWNPNGLDAVHIANTTSISFDKLNTFNRIYEITTFRPTRNGFYFGGNGETVIEDLVALNAGNYGFHFVAQNDYKVSNCTAGGSYKTGMRIFVSSSGHFVNCKSYYSGAGGGSDDADCANWYINADQLRTGLAYFTQCEGQESRGCSWIIDNAGLCTLDACQGLDPGRDGLNSGILPAVVAGLYLKGRGASNNFFNDFYTGPSVAIFNFTNNWGQATDAIYIQGVDGNGAGPQNNQGTFGTFQPFIKADGTLDPGTNYRMGYGPIGGTGSTNGRNTGCFINTIRLPNAIPAAPVNLTATPGSTTATLNWDLLFTGGIGTISVTNYVIEYKLHADVSWTTFSHSPITAGPITVTGLTNNLYYDFRVSATNSVGTGPTATVLNVQILVTVPDQVTGLVATPGQGFIGTTWTIPFNGNTPITDYLVEYKLSSSGSWLTLGHTASATPSQFLIDVVALSYDFRVSAINAVGTGAVSSTASATGQIPLVNFDASITANITESGGAVSAFADASGNGYTAVQSTAGKKPITGSTTINSLNTIVYDGVDDYLKATLSVTGFLAGQSYATLFSVFAAPSGATSTGAGFSYYTNNVADRLMEQGIGTGTIYSIGKMAAADLQWYMFPSGPTLTTNQESLTCVRVRRNATSYLISSHITGSPLGSPNATTNNPFTAVVDQSIFLGALKQDFSFLNCARGQDVIYGGNLTDAQVNGIGNALAYKWGQTWTNI